VFVAGCGKRTEENSGSAKTDAIPNYANWDGVTEAYFKKTGVRVPPDMKGSSAAMAAAKPKRTTAQADTVYYSGAIGYQAASKGLHQSYKPSGWERIPVFLGNHVRLFLRAGEQRIIVDVPNDVLRDSRRNWPVQIKTSKVCVLAKENSTPWN
jgi:hypothetical protein